MVFARTGLSVTGDFIVTQYHGQRPHGQRPNTDALGNEGANTIEGGKETHTGKVAYIHVIGIRTDKVCNRTDDSKIIHVGLCGDRKPTHVILLSTVGNQHTNKIVS